MTQTRVPVAILGGGPVGLALALMLDRYGVRSVIFNTEPTTRWHPKGGTHGARTMEHYRALGIAERIRALGFPADQPTDVVYLTRFGGYELARLKMPSTADRMRAVAASSATDQVPEPMHRANQMYVERFLLEHARTRPNIAGRFGWRVENFAEDNGGVTLNAVCEQDSRREEWRSDFLAGCDGGQGLVRRSLGIRYAGGDALQQAFLGGAMVSSYVRVPDLSTEYLRGDPAFQYWLINPQFRTAVISVNGSDEFMVWTKPAADGGLDTASPIEMIRRGTRSDMKVEVLGQNPWTAGVALVAESYGSARTFLVGDSAHLFTPTGGFGMNTGIDDAANLAWKLAAMGEGWGGAHLLSTYESERRPIALRNTGAARELGKSIGTVETPPEMEENSAAGEAARHKVAAVLGAQYEQYASIGVQLGARYDGSRLVVADGAPPADDFVNYRPSGVPGGRAPHVWLDAGRGAGSSLYDRLGKGFTFLRLSPTAPDGAALVAAAARSGCPLTVLDAPPVARDLYGRDLALIRPDHHIAWRGDELPDDPAQLLARVSGH